MEDNPTQDEPNFSLDNPRRSRRLRANMAIQMSGEQFQQLMNAMAQARIEEGTHTFDGTRDYHVVEDFITNVSTYIQTKHIRENNAVMSLGLLLKDEAKRWWTGVKSTFRTWNEVIDAIRNVFQPPQPNW